MIQRYIYKAVDAALRAYKQNPGLYDQVFTGNFGLDPQETDEIRRYFTENPINLTHGFPPEMPKFPTITIILAGEEQSDFILARAAGSVTDPTDPAYRSPLHSVFFHHTYQLLCYSESIDVTTYLYEIAKSAIIAAYEYLRDNDVDDVTMTGMDISPDTARLPAHLWARVLQVRCRREMVMTGSASIDMAFKVGQVHNPPGSPQDNGGVVPGVTSGT